MCRSRDGRWQILGTAPCDDVLIRLGHPMPPERLETVGGGEFLTWRTACPDFLAYDADISEREKKKFKFKFKFKSARRD